MHLFNQRVPQKPRHVGRQDDQDSLFKQTFRLGLVAAAVLNDSDWRLVMGHLIIIPAALSNRFDFMFPSCELLCFPFPCSN